MDDKWQRNPRQPRRAMKVLLQQSSLQRVTSEKRKGMLLIRPLAPNFSVRAGCAPSMVPKALCSEKTRRRTDDRLKKDQMQADGSGELFNI
jgi:hypothetical protein